MRCLIRTLGRVVMSSRLTTQGAGIPSARSKGTSTGIFLMVRVTGAPVIAARTRYAASRLRSTSGRLPAGSSISTNQTLTALHRLPLFFRQPFGEQFGRALRPVEIFRVPLIPFHVSSVALFCLKTFYTLLILHRHLYDPFSFVFCLRNHPANSFLHST